MTKWQRRARLVIAIGAVSFAIAVVFALKRRGPEADTPAPRTDPGAVVEVTGGRVERFKLSRQDVRVAYERQLTYANGSTKLMDVTIAADERAGRSFTVTGREANVGQNESTIVLNGDVRLSASDGMTVRTEHATYSDAAGLVYAAGPVEFARGRMTGAGIGMRYDTARDVLAILDRAVVHVAPDEKGAGAAEVTSGTATFSRREKTIRFERDVTLLRDRQRIEAADTAAMYLTPDEKQIERMELRGRSRITMDKPAAGALAELGARDIDLRYGADGQTLERAALMGEGAIVLAGEAGMAGRQIRADAIDVTLAPDGATPVSLTGRESVVLTLPAERGVPERTIRSATMDGTGEPGRGLTRATFTDNVEFRERGSDVDRVVNSGTLDVALKPAMAGLQDARFAHRVHFVDGGMTSDAAAARYDLEKGTLELTGSEPGALRPRVVNGQLAVDAQRIDVTLAGPRLKAAGAVKSVVQPARAAGRGGRAASETRVPSMFKQDRPVNVTADALDYDGTAHKATYTGGAQLWQEDTSLKGGSIVLDDDTGDLAANGSVTTVTVRDSAAKGRKPERVRSIATASDFRYEEALRRATYSGNAHMNSPDGDMTASTIELYLKESGQGDNDLERVEAYESVTLREQSRTTTGTRLTYTTADERYVVTGAPVKVLDECRRETIGRTLTYLKSAETITIDGNEQTRTQTKGSAQCP